MAARGPLIGVTSGASTTSRRGRADYRIALREFGARTVLLTPEDGETAARCQGIVFTGGYDIHPSLYPRRAADRDLTDEEIIQRYKLEGDDPRDAFELPLAREAIAKGIPALGICRGFQVFNVVAGGGLIPDIPRCLGDSVRHRAPKGERIRHTIEVQRGSLLASVLASQEPEVNTFHHQGITCEEIASGMKAAARAADGLIEAIELAGHPFLVGVQWHPERRKDPDVKERFRGLFEAFVAAARERSV